MGTRAPVNSGDDKASGDLTVNLQIKSPSVGVTRPILFPGLPATTTIKQLKEMIRNSLPMRPEDKSQRLIHRGRAVATDSDTLLNVIGADLVGHITQLENLRFAQSD